VKVLLFDIDGTLIRAGGAGRLALNAACEELFGKKDACSELTLAGHTDLFNFREAFVNAKGRRPSKDEMEALHEKYLEHLPSFVEKALRSKTYLYPPGIKALLKRLSKERRVLLGLGTGNMERGARIKLEPSGFNAYFLFGGYGSDAFHRPTLLKRAVRRAQKLVAHPIKSDDVFVIGDTPLDVAAGKKAGFKTVGVGTGYASWEALVDSRPDHIAKDFRGTDQWLSWFGIK
jgi:phosphoglycolate phosphatase-like HAD superfamily hydrolase